MLRRRIHRPHPGRYDEFHGPAFGNALLADEGDPIPNTADVSQRLREVAEPSLSETMMELGATLAGILAAMVGICFAASLLN